MTETQGGESKAFADGSREALLHDLLERTSRTFALAIPLLPRPVDRQVTTAYLLFRIADTFEDATVLWTREHRLQALGEFAELLESPSIDGARRLADTWLETAPTEHEGYVDLLRHTPEVIADLLGMPEGVREVMARHTRRTAQGMSGFVRRSPPVGEIELSDLEDLKAYCYVVAGIVGEMLTDLFLLAFESIRSVGLELRERAAAFGEGLQLVNVLKDSADDRREGRIFVPLSTDRADVFGLARGDLARAAEYCRILQRVGAPRGVTAFTASPVALARAALDRIERDGPGAKLTRPEVLSLHAKVQAALAVGRPVFSELAEETP